MSDLRALLDNATPRPWYADGPDIDAQLGENDWFDVATAENESADAALIVALVNQADELLAVAEAAFDDDLFNHHDERRRVAAIKRLADAQVAYRAALARLDAKEQT